MPDTPPDNAPVTPPLNLGVPDAPQPQPVPDVPWTDPTRNTP